jgi:hypothetical protein
MGNISSRKSLRDMKKATEYIKQVPIIIYESASSDGYNTTGDFRFFPTEAEAKTYADSKHGDGYGRVNERWALPHNGGVYILACQHLCTLYEVDKEDVRKKALAKLSDFERKVLGV